MRCCGDKADNYRDGAWGAYSINRGRVVSTGDVRRCGDKADNYRDGAYRIGGRIEFSSDERA
eukprot:6078823-Pyramimonas_sp.AAC.1